MLLSGLLRTYNEEANIARALDDLLSFCDEVVISDGGSTDRTKEIARSYGPSVIWLDFPEGSISDKVHFNHAGRQYSYGLARCHGDWVIVNDVDIIHCPWLRAHLREILADTDCDAFAMYGVHVVGDWDHYAAELSTGPGMIQLFRNYPGLTFPDLPEHACHMNHIPWRKLGILRGGVFHYGYLNREQELAKIRLRAQALPDDPTYQKLSQEPPQHEMARIPWERCGPDCTSCWMEEAVYPFIYELQMKHENLRHSIAETEKQLAQLRHASSIIQQYLHALGVQT